MTIHIIDYGMGNLRSVQKAFERLGHTAELATDAEQIAAADRLVLPGVGAFRDAIARLDEAGLSDPIRRHVEQDKPFLGICLGLQLLFDVSYEDGEYEGLGILPGEVVRFVDQPGLKIPHMGWNRLTLTDTENPIFAGLPADPYVYFVHSYYAQPTDSSVIAATSDHDIEFVSAVRRDNLFAVQFHPEKSQAVGMKMLSSFAGVACAVAG